MRKSKSASVSVTIKVTNKLVSARALVIEPWLDEFVLEPGKTLHVILHGDPKWPLEIEIDDDRFVVYGFDSTDATVSVQDQGVRAKDVNVERARRRQE
jgi:hypothetical protein